MTAWTAWINVATGAADQVDTHTHVAADVTDFSEAVDDRVAVLAVAGTNMTITYNDAGNALTFAATGYTDEQAQDAVGAMVDASLTYVDATPLLQIAALGVTTGKLADDAVTYAKMQNASGASVILGRGSAAGPGDYEPITLGSGLTMTGTTISAASGSSLGGEATITLTSGVYEWIETVAATGVTAAHKIVISSGAYSDADENSAEMLAIQCLSGLAGTNQIIVTAAFEERTSGPIKLSWSAF